MKKKSSINNLPAKLITRINLTLCPNKEILFSIKCHFSHLLLYLLVHSRYFFQFIINFYQSVEFLDSQIFFLSFLNPVFYKLIN